MLVGRMQLPCLNYWPGLPLAWGGGCGSGSWVQQIHQIWPELKARLTRIEIGDVVDSPVSPAALVHLIKQSVWDAAGYTSTAKLHTHFSLDVGRLLCAAAGYFCSNCFGLGIAEHIEIDKATIRDWLEFSGSK